MITNSKIIMDQYVIQVKGNIVSNMGEEKVMLSIESGKYYNLGEVGGVIWDLIEKKIKVNELVKDLLSMYEVDKTVCEDQVLSFLEPLLEEGLIQISDEL